MKFNEVKKYLFSEVSVNGNMRLAFYSYFIIKRRRTRLFIYPSRVPDKNDEVIYILIRASFPRILTSISVLYVRCP